MSPADTVPGLPIARNLLTGPAGTTVKQLPVVLAFVVAICLTTFVPGLEFSNSGMAVAGIGIVAFATILALLPLKFGSYGQLVILIPLLDMAAVGFFRIGTGGTTSIFGSIMVLPVIWIASERGRQHIAIAAAGSSLFLLMPYLMGIGGESSASDWLRGFYSPLVFATVAAIVNETGRQGRKQIAAIAALAEERERLLAESQRNTALLRENEARLVAADRLTRSVLDSVTEQSVIGTDTFGVIDVWNPGAERMLGLTSSEAQGKRHISEFHLEEELSAHARENGLEFDTANRASAFAALVGAAPRGTAEVGQWKYLRPDGKTVPVELAVTRRQGDSGVTVGYIFVATDVSQALEVSRLKDEFVGLISHELRTPLSSVLGYLELMRDDTEDPLSGDQRQYLAVAERNAHRLLSLVGDLLFTAQVGAGHFSIDVTDVDLIDVASGAVESAQPVAVRAGVGVELRLAESRLMVRGDALRLGQALDNLISNAVKFSPRDSTVIVEVAVKDTKAVVTVTDSGMGIPNDELNQLFTRFFRASTATRAAVPGIGLGLAVTKAIITAHEGELDIASEVGVGTVLSFTVPLSAQPPRARDAAGSELSAGTVAPGAS